MRARVLLVLAALVALPPSTLAEPRIVAMGNLAVVYSTKGALSTEQHPLHATANNLWCQATLNGEPQLIEWARFVRVNSHAVFEGTVDDTGKKASMTPGSAPAYDAGKYRCEIKTRDGDVVYGNLFVYTRPIIHDDDNLRLEVHDSDPFTVIGAPITGPEGGSVNLTCPTAGYPTPSINWYKDGEPLESSDRVIIKNNLVTIKGLSKEDEGHYRCTASNAFPMRVDEDVQSYEAHLDQELKISNGLGWIYPLIVIIIIFLVLFCIIWSCAAWKNYKADQYNVAKQEKLLRKADLMDPEYDLEKQ